MLSSYSQSIQCYQHYRDQQLTKAIIGPTAHYHCWTHSGLICAAQLFMNQRYYSWVPLLDPTAIHEPTAHYHLFGPNNTYLDLTIITTYSSLIGKMWPTAHSTAHIHEAHVTLTKPSFTNPKPTIASLDRITSSHYALLFRDIHVLQRIMELWSHHSRDTSKYYHPSWKLKCFYKGGIVRNLWLVI